MIYCINTIKYEKSVGSRTAGKKAPDDVAKIVETNFHAKIIHFAERESANDVLGRHIEKVINTFKNWNKVFKDIKTGDVLIVQHPYEGVFACSLAMRLLRIRKVKIIIFIHDLLMLRSGIESKVSNHKINKNRKLEQKVLELSDCIIAHNSSMKEYLKSIGISEHKVFELSLFDYLTDCSIDGDRGPYDGLIIAGNLSKNKSAYIYSFIECDDRKEILHLYGPNYEESSFNDVYYEGVFDSDALPHYLIGAYGIVWDGNSIDGCNGAAGEYLKFNNPHKLSLYIRAGLPVIVWEKSAIARFVHNNDIGIAVASLRDISRAIEVITQERYSQLQSNVAVLQKKISLGKFTVESLTNAIEYIESENGVYN